MEIDEQTAAQLGLPGVGADDPRHPQRVKEVLRRLQDMYPEADTELNFSSTFELLVAVILSAQTTDERVNIVTAELFKKYNQPADYLDLSQEELEQYIKSIGLYHNKAKFILATCRKLVDEFDSQVPGTRKELMSLPGVGRKTANVVLSNAFDQDAIAVDTHVDRVSHRLGWAQAKNVRQTESELQAVIPKSLWSKAHHLLIWHGRRTCDARKPACDRCQLLELCPEGQALSAS